MTDDTVHDWLLVCGNQNPTKGVFDGQWQLERRENKNKNLHIYHWTLGIAFGFDLSDLEFLRTYNYGKHDELRTRILGLNCQTSTKRK